MQHTQTRYATNVTPVWLPDFCSLPVLFALVVVAELVVIVVALTPAVKADTFWSRLGSASLFAQWLALIFSVSLCKLRPWLLRRPPWIGEAIAYGFMVGATLLASLLVAYIDRALGLGFIETGEPIWYFATRNGVICALIAAALLRYFYVQEQWREGVRAEARARFEALQARIRPHFLFNSMNTIASLVRVRPVAAEAAVEDLADLFRAALGQGEATCTLGEELDLARGYLRIEELRLGDRLCVAWDVTDAPRELILPSLLLQPLVENAVYHGVQPLPAGGTVTLRTRRMPGAVEIEVRNPCPLSVQRTSQGNGHALANIRARIEYHFGGRGALTVDHAEDEFVCRLRLPDDASRRD